MDDLIRRQDAIDALSQWDWQDMYLPIHFKQLLEELPSAQKKGHWIDKDICYQCSECGYDSLGHGNYCPNCGAYMKGEE